MSLVLPCPELWFRRNLEVSEALGASKTDVVKTYSSLQQAAFEVGFATATFYSHKKVVGVMSGASPAGTSIWPLLAKEGFATPRISQRQSWAEVETWLNSLKPETSLVMMNEDHPVTGEIFTELNDKVTAYLATKKLFAIRISHFSWRESLKPFLTGSAPAAQKLGGWTSFVCELSPHKAFALLGSRVKVPNLVAQLEPFDSEEIAQWKSEIAESLGGQKLHPRPVHWPEGFTQWHSPNTKTDEASRMCLLTHPQIQAEALWQSLGRPAGLEPLNACHLSDVDWNWWEDRPVPADFRGMLSWDRKFPFPDLETFAEKVSQQNDWKL